MAENKNQVMQLAINSALEGVNKTEGGPFGACVVRNGEILSVAHNTVLRDHDPTCHAEMNAIRLACKQIGSHILTGCEIYTTAEPCPMCLAAIYWARLDKIYVGVDKAIAAKFGFDDAKFYDELLLQDQKREVPSEKGILAKESEEVFQHWKAIGGVLY